jgi:hypothetical protein
MILYRPCPIGHQGFGDISDLPSFFVQLARSAAPVLLTMTIFACAARADDPDYEALARQQFGQANYKEASATVRLAMYKGIKTPALFLLLGECYEKQGENGAARQSYNSIVQYFPRSRESQIALEHLSTMPAAVGGAQAGNGPTFVGKHLIDRIAIVPPQFGHPAVDAGTVGLVRDIVSRLPKPIYKILDQGKTNIFVTPNLIDKFPKEINYRFAYDGSYLSAQLARTYDRDIYICERHALTGGGIALSPIYDSTSLSCTTYTQLAHALDDCLERPSKDEQYLQLFRQDAAAADIRKYPDMKNYVKEEAQGPGETFAGIAAGLMGFETRLSDELNHTFPRSRAWIERRIQMLSGGSTK